MKILSIGDTHGYSVWKKAPCKDADKIIFLGDYVDSFHLSDVVIIQNLRDIIQFKLENPDHVELLYGNHDLMYLFLDKINFRCTGFRDTYSVQLHEIFKEYKQLFKIAYQEQNLLYTHAGVSKEWVNYNKEAFDYCMDYGGLGYILNNILNSRHYGIFTQVPKQRGGTAHFGSPIWADTNEFLFRKSTLLGDWKQIVGHTRRDEIFTFNYKKNKTCITFTDVIENKIESGDTNYETFFHIEHI